jgi:hypothetical protein
MKRRRWIPFIVGVGAGVVLALMLFDVDAVWIGAFAAVWFAGLLPFAASVGRRA